MIRKLVELVNYEEHLKKTQQDWQSRWENVQELITFASEIEADVEARAQRSKEDEVEPESPPDKWVFFFGFPDISDSISLNADVPCGISFSHRCFHLKEIMTQRRKVMTYV